MGYWQESYDVNCSECGDVGTWIYTSRTSTPPECSRCPKCGCYEIETTYSYPEQPPPPNVYIGADKYKRIKLLPLPHGVSRLWDGMQPYSVRSILYQLSREDGWPHRYHPDFHGLDKYGNYLWEDTCSERDDYGNWIDYGKCCVATGWMTGEVTCKGWELIKGLCQTDAESAFLHDYLRYVKDREFPMLIPQAWLTWEERRRIDFMLYVPKTHHHWRKIAVQIDPKGSHKDSRRDEIRDLEIRAEGYDVLSYDTDELRIEQVRKLISKVDEIQPL